MFLESRVAVIVGIILILVGAFKASSSRQYADAAHREVIVKGTITYVSGGKNPRYDYEFTRNGFKTQGESLSCHSAQSPQGCRTGAPVLVYYDPGQIVETTLEEYGQIGREKLFLGICLIIVGFLLAVLHFVLKRMEAAPDSSETLTDSDAVAGSEDLHVAPRE